MFLLWIVYRVLGRKGSAEKPDTTFTNTCLAPSVSEWSARTGGEHRLIDPLLIKHIARKNVAVLSGFSLPKKH